MSELGETFSLMRDASRDKRASNRTASAQMLVSNSIEFESKNFGAHLILEINPKIDFWPGTGLWISRCGKKGRGIRKLIKFVNRRG